MLLPAIVADTDRTGDEITLDEVDDLTRQKLQLIQLKDSVFAACWYTVAILGTDGGT